MPSPRSLPSPPHQSPRSFHPLDPHRPQNTSDPDLRHDTREGRPRGLAHDDKKRSRSNSTPPDNRHIRDPNSPQQTGFPPVSASSSRAWAMSRGWSTGTVGIDVEAQGQGLVQVGGQVATQLAANLNPRGRRNSDAQPPAPTSGRMSISASVDMGPVIPRLSNDGRVLTRPRKNSYRRPRILFYHKHQPHYGFTNFSTHTVEYGGRKYPTSEHLFQSFKVCRTRQKLPR